MEDNKQAPEAATAAEAKQARSHFVTVVAWVFICLGGAFALIGGLELVIMLFVSQETIQKLLQGNQAVSQMPAYTRFFLSHLTAYLSVSFVALSILFVTAIGLLKRKAWARPTMIVLLAIGSIRYIVVAVVQLLSHTPAPVPANASPAAVAGMQGMMSIVMHISSAFSLAIAGVFVWIIVRLLSPAIKAEFNAAAPDLAPAGEPGK